MKAGTSTELFQNNKICTTPRSKICTGDVHVLDLFPVIGRLRHQVYWDYSWYYFKNILKSLEYFNIISGILAKPIRLPMIS